MIGIKHKPWNKLKLSKYLPWTMIKIDVDFGAVFERNGKQVHTSHTSHEK